MLDDTAFRGRRLCVVGNVNRDVRLAPIAAGDYLFQDGETPTESVRETVGGGAANSACAAAALGADVALVGKVGADALGQRVHQALVARGVRPYLNRDGRHPTGTSVNLVFDTGRRHFVSCLAGSATLTYEEINPAALGGAEHLLRADVWFSETMLFGGNALLFAAARSAGAAVSLDVNWDPQWGRAAPAAVAARKEAVRGVLPLVDLVHGNVRELCAFADESAFDLDAALRRIEGWGAGAVVVHMGTDGAAFYRRGHLTRAACVKAPRSVNTAGTGDVLSVCMALLHGREDVAADEKLWLANQIVSEYVAGLRQCVPELA